MWILKNVNFEKCKFWKKKKMWISIWILKKVNFNMNLEIKKKRKEKKNSEFLKIRKKKCLDRQKY